MIKRLIDVGLCLAVIVVIIPLVIAVSGVVLLKLGKPVLFRQTRIGRCEGEFKLVKFRTMTDGMTMDGQVLPDCCRLTSLGLWLRRWSIDELPQLWNVIRGEMSLVGPRPLLPQYLSRYSARQRRRHEVRPGITGWAQVNGRNLLSWEDKLDLDVWYVDHQSVWLDLRILWMTVVQVLGRKGISADGHATMPEFIGNTARGDQQ